MLIFAQFSVLIFINSNPCYSIQIFANEDFLADDNMQKLNRPNFSQIFHHFKNINMYLNITEDLST